MKIQVLGTGSKGNCYVIEVGLDILIIEAGVRLDTVKRAIDYRIEDVNGVLVSHIHGDHAKFIHTYEHSFKNCYSPREVIDRKQLKRTGELKQMKLIELGNFSVKPLLVEHDCIDNFAFNIHHDKMGNLLYITDTNSFSRIEEDKRLYYLPERTDYLMIEANYSKELLKDNVFNAITTSGLADRVVDTHMSIEEATATINRLNERYPIKRILLVHLSQSNIDDIYAKQYVEGFTGIPTDVAINRKIYEF